MSEQVNCGFTHAFGARLLNHADSAALPVDAHDFSDAINRCLLVDKTMFIADILDSEEHLLRFAVGPRVLARA